MLTAKSRLICISTRSAGFPYKLLIYSFICSMNFSVTSLTESFLYCKPMVRVFCGNRSSTFTPAGRFCKDNRGSTAYACSMMGSHWAVLSILYSSASTTSSEPSFNRYQISSSTRREVFILGFFIRKLWSTSGKICSATEENAPICRLSCFSLANFCAAENSDFSAFLL